MKLLTKLKLRLEGVLKSVNHDLKQQLAVYKEKEQMGEQYV